MTYGAPYDIIRVSKGQGKQKPGDRKAGDTMNQTTDKMEETIMTDTQARRADLYARLDELNRLKDLTTDRELLNLIAEREKALRAALDSTLNA